MMLGSRYNVGKRNGLQDEYFWAPQYSAYSSHRNWQTNFNQRNWYGTNSRYTSQVRNDRWPETNCIENICPDGICVFSDDNDRDSCFDPGDLIGSSEESDSERPPTMRPPPPSKPKPRPPSKPKPPPSTCPPGRPSPSRPSKPLPKYCSIPCEPTVLPLSTMYYPAGPYGPRMSFCPYVPLCYWDDNGKYNKPRRRRDEFKPHRQDMRQSYGVSSRGL